MNENELNKIKKIAKIRTNRFKRLNVRNKSLKMLKQNLLNEEIKASKAFIELCQMVFNFYIKLNLDSNICESSFKKN